MLETYVQTLVQQQQLAAAIKQPAVGSDSRRARHNQYLAKKAETSVPAAILESR
jgi:hypothetical protein